MQKDHRFLRTASALVAVGAVFVLSGCAAKVTRKDFESEVAKIRQEQQDGDKALMTRVDATDAKVAEHSTRLDEVEKNLQSLRTEFNATVERMHSMLRFNAPIHFAFDDATIRESDMPVLDRFAGVVKQAYPEAHITIEGFADPAGSTAYNQKLGLRRADAVRNYLTAQGGLVTDRVKTVSYGEARNRQVVPGAAGPGDEGLQNRRVTLVIDYQGEEAPAAAAAYQEEAPRQ